MRKVAESKAIRLFSLMAEACHAFEKIAGTYTARIHFSYKGKKDRLVLTCEKGQMKQIAADDKTCTHGELLRWQASEFSQYTPEQAFMKFFDSVSKIHISHPRMEKTWDSLASFEAWLKNVAKGKIEEEKAPKSRKLARFVS